MTQNAALTIDIDTLSSLYKGIGNRRVNGYTHVDFRMGLEKIHEFFQAYGIKTTLFMVGNDFLRKENHGALISVCEGGHELGNHSMTHTQGFRLLSVSQKENEILMMDKICFEVAGIKPVGFRAPGWNISDDTLPLLKKYNYQYDSSVFPTSFLPLMKFAHWHTMSNRMREDRTTMGMMKYIFAPTSPYRTNGASFSRKGRDSFLEFPVTVSPFFRIPFFATFLFKTGMRLFKSTYWRLKSMGMFINFQLHLSDFIEYTHTDLYDQVPDGKDGVYVPDSMHIPLSKKLDILKQAIDIIGQDYLFDTLAAYANPQNSFISLK